jgi:chemotaxis methyl-accepting protein methylase
MAILHPEIQGRGIEIVPDRIRWANQALERIRSRQVATRIQFRQGSFLDSELSLRDACWIFISNLCFDEATQHEIVKKVEAECAPNTIIICSKELPFSKETSQFERVEAGTNIPMTWSATSTCNIYRRKALII